MIDKSSLTPIPIDLSIIERGPEFARIDSIRELVLRQMTALPPRSKPVADLTDRDKVALALAAGAPYITEMIGADFTIRTAVPVGIVDRGDGGYIIAIGSMRK